MFLLQGPLQPLRKNSQIFIYAILSNNPINQRKNWCKGLISLVGVRILVDKIKLKYSCLPPFLATNTHISRQPSSIAQSLPSRANCSRASILSWNEPSSYNKCRHKISHTETSLTNITSNPAMCNQVFIVQVSKIKIFIITIKDKYQRLAMYSKL